MHGEYSVAEDTGGAIKGNRIDIAIMNREKATEFGIKPVKVYVVNTPKE
jgi:3D (Asp-Asp-Asp) domain-containing protein